MRVPSLHQFFRHQLQPGFRAGGIDEPATIDYVSDVLARFAETRVLYAVAGADGKPLQYIVDFLVERQRAETGTGGRGDYARVRTLTRHLGEFALFMSGMFRERLVRRGELSYYLAQGAGAYWTCADAEMHPGRRRIYRQICGHFRDIADTLDGLRRTRQPPAPAGTAPEPLAAFWHS
jgi:hypothetical protein